MHAINFTHSYMTWFPHEADGNIARIQLDAACTIVDEQAGTRETFYLIAPCRAERMYLDEPLFQMPNYEFCGIWSADEILFIRTAWVSQRDNRQYVRGRERFRDIRLDIRTFDQCIELHDDAAIVQATLENRPLIARTKLIDEQTGLCALLEYPIKTMNVLQLPFRFQVDTGPLIVPNWTATATHRIECFDIAHVVYHTFEKAEFILRRPVPVGDGDDPTLATTDYSIVRIMAAHNTILAA